MQTREPYQSVDVLQASSRLQQGWKPFVLDVRGSSEAAISTLDFTDQLQAHTSVHLIADQLPKDRDILVYCRSGGRSAYACEVLFSLGVTNLFNLEGGINEWAQAVDPELTVY